MCEDGFENVRGTNHRSSPTRLLRLDKLPKRSLSQHLRSTIYVCGIRRVLSRIVRGGIPVIVRVDFADAWRNFEVQNGGEGGGEDYAFDLGLKFGSCDEVPCACDGGLEHVLLVVLYDATQIFYVSRLS